MDAHQALEACAEGQECVEVLAAGILDVAVGVEAPDLRSRGREAADEVPALILRHAEDPFRLLDQLWRDRPGFMLVGGHAEAIERIPRLRRQRTAWRDRQPGADGTHGDRTEPVARQAQSAQDLVVADRL